MHPQTHAGQFRARPRVLCSQVSTGQRVTKLGDKVVEAHDGYARALNWRQTAKSGRRCLFRRSRNRKPLDRVSRVVQTCLFSPICNPETSRIS